MVLRSEKLMADAGVNSTLLRGLRTRGVIALGVSGIIGSGIFVLTGTAAGLYAGPAIAISFLIAGFACLLAGLCYAEFAAMFPVSGSAYSYTYVTLGEGAGWVVAWNLVLEYLVVCSLLAVGWSGYFGTVLGDMGIHLPPAFASSPLALGEDLKPVLTGAVINLPAIAIIALVTSILCLGIRQSAIFGAVMMVLKLSVITLFVIFGILYADPANWSPFVPANQGTFGAFGVSGILRAAAVVFVAYLGFDAVSTMAQETRDPQRAMPRAIFGTLAIVTLAYVAMAIAMTGLAPYAALAVPNSVDVAVRYGGPQLAWLKPLISLVTVVGLASSMLVVLIGQSRIFMAMSRDGLLPPIFHEVHPKRKNPVKGTIVIAAIAAILAGLLPVTLLGELVAIGTLMAFAIVCLCVPILRRREPELHRPFRTPFVPIVPLAGAAWCIALMASLPLVTWLTFLIWLTIGAGIYLGYGRRHSVLRLSQTRVPSSLDSLQE